MEFRILGPLEVSDGDRVVALGRGRQRCLLAVLLLHADEVVSSDRLIDELWADDAAPATASKSVQVYVSQLRKALRQCDAPGGNGNGEGPLLTRPGGYVLSLESAQLDLRRFERSLEDGRRALAGDQPGRAAERLRDGLALWRGAPLADLSYEPFAQPAIARLEELRLAAIEERIEADLRLGRHTEIVAEVEELVAAHPVRERLRRQWMLALYRCDRQVEALEAYHEGREILVSQLGLEPSPTLRRLQQEILAQSPELALTAPPRAQAAAPPATASAAAPTERTVPPPDRAPAPVRSHRRLIAAGALLLVAAALGAVLSLGSGSASRTQTIVPPLRFNALAAVNTGGGIDAAVVVPGRLGRLAVDRTAVWVGSDDSRTLSAVDLRTHRLVRTVVPGAFPSDIAVGEGSVWVADGHAGAVVRVDQAYGRVVSRTALPRPRGVPAAPADRFETDPTSVAVGAGGVWVTDGAHRVVRIDPATGQIAAMVPTRQPVGAVAVGAGAVWAVSGASAAILRIDPATNRVTDTIGMVSRPDDASPYPVAVAAREPFVWVLSANTADVTRIDAGTRRLASTSRIGIDRDPGQIAAGPGAAWVANGDGTLARVDAQTGAVTSQVVGRGLRDVGVAADGVWVTNQLTRCCGQE